MDRDFWKELFRLRKVKKVKEMIKADKGHIEFKGSGGELLEDYSVITESLAKSLINNGFSKKEAKELLQTSFDIAFEDIETLKEKCIGEMKSGLKKLLELLKGVTNHE